MRAFKALVAGGCLLLSAVSAHAQQVEIKATPPPAKERQILTPPLRYEVTRPTDQSFYTMGEVRVPYDPAFIAGISTGFATPTQTGWYGFSGWTSPNTPVGSTSAAGSGFSEDSGWFALGFSIIWNGPPPAKRAAAP